MPYFILEAMKYWRWERPGNEAIGNSLAGVQCSTMVTGVQCSTCVVFQASSVALLSWESSADKIHRVSTQTDYCLCIKLLVVTYMYLHSVCEGKLVAEMFPRCPHYASTLYMYSPEQKICTPALSVTSFALSFALGKPSLLSHNGT